MITLRLPNGVEEVYYWMDNMILGPLTLSGMPSEKVSTTFRANLDHLSQGRGNYHENFVGHTEVKGSLRYEPILADIVAAPTTYLFDRVNWTRRNYSGALSTQYADLGLVSDGDIKYYRNSTSTYNRYVRVVSPTSFAVWKVHCNNSDPTLCQILTREEYSFNRVSGNTLYLNYKTQSNVSAYRTSFPMNRRLTYYEIQEIISARPPNGGISTSTKSALMYKKASSAASLSMDLAKLQINSFIVKHLNWGYPLEMVHFGELAMKASEKVNANQVNMIAFLRDLRKPQEMIPKLKNLLSLKTMSDNYLSVNYGILPTIDDIKSIFEACKKVKPYLDRNGFAVYTAAHFDEATRDITTYTLEQRIKLAIDNEDFGLTEVISRIESMGFLPTFENIWDLVPYSFVVDWLVDVGGFLERVDTRLRLQRLGVRYATTSYKRTAKADYPTSPTSPYIGNLELVRYQRETSDQCPVPPLSASTTFQDFNHWLEASALLIQRKK